MNCTHHILHVFLLFIGSLVSHAQASEGQPAEFNSSPTHVTSHSIDLDAVKLADIRNTARDMGKTPSSFQKQTLGSVASQDSRGSLGLQSHSLGRSTGSTSSGQLVGVIDRNGFVVLAYGAPKAQ